MMTVESIYKEGTDMRFDDIFNNREIAIGIWIILAFLGCVFLKSFRKAVKSILSILCNKTFVRFFLMFLIYFFLTISLLQKIGFWTIDLLKDTIFWAIFVELPLFAKAIKKGKDTHFFTVLLKNNFKLTIAVGFVLNFWTFSLLTELIIIPITVAIAMLYAVILRDKKHLKIKRFLDISSMIFGVVVIINAIKNIVYYHAEILTVLSLKQLVLPMILLIFNLPVVYGLALYCVYDGIFVRVKGCGSEKRKMKQSIIRFAGFSLYKITAIRNNLATTTVISLDNKTMVENLRKLDKRLSFKIGENYMKRANFYIVWCMLGSLISVIGLVVSNSQVPINDLLTLNFTLDVVRLKEIATYIFCTSLVFSTGLLICSIGFKKRKYEEISQVKKFALHETTFLIKKQYHTIQVLLPIDKPKDLFYQYVLTAYELYKVTSRDMELYENLLKTWEMDVLRKLNTATLKVVNAIGISKNDIENYTADMFESYFLEKKKTARQNEKINIFVHDVETGLKDYSEQIKRCYEEFKAYMD